MMRISKEFAEILGLLCAEGSHIVSFSSYWGKERGKLYYRNNKKSERIEFYNKDKKLLHHYADLLCKEFCMKTKVTKFGKINIGKREIMTKIITQTPLGHMRWRVPKAISLGTKAVKIAFLRGYFDGDGTAITCPRMFSTNRAGLRQVSQLLSSLNFKHTLQGPHYKEKRKPAYTIQISRKDKERFLNLIRPVSKKLGLRG
ncbi:MAG TPA: LAGLIDADG family homing endonuclease [Candidatus Nanoarchaeia archaeon]|nr:LAGLIDADG family homing endonuclease [Candidatus Nanoarchaeia archaeon]